jgi:hypothetical protein
MSSTYGYTERVLDAGVFGKDHWGNNPLPEREMTQGERQGFEQVRMRADRALQVCKVRPDKPQRGETVQTYERKILQELKKFSPSLNWCDFSYGTPEQVADFAPTVLKEALAAPKRRGELAEVRLRDRSGRVISEFEGDKNTWLNQFRGIGWAMTEINGKAPIIPAI